MWSIYTLDTLHYPMREIPLICCLNRLIQTINIFVVTVTMLTAVPAQYTRERHSWKILKNSACNGGIYTFLPQFSWKGWYFPMFVLTQVVFHFHLDNFFPTADVVFGRWVVHTSVSSLNGSQPKVGHFPSPLPCLNGYPLPSFTLTMKEKGLNNLPSL